MLSTNHSARIIRLSAIALGFLTVQAQAETVQVTIENLTPAGGIFFTPVWVGFHDGNFDLYDLGSAATPGLERLAEDGTTSVLSDEFLLSQTQGVDGVVTEAAGFAGAPVFDPGGRASLTLEVDATSNAFFSYATMVIPSNDAFVANANPQAHRLFDESGNFAGPISFTVFGQQVRDGGTEDNTEMDAAFLNQTGLDTGVTSNDVVAIHPGFNGSFSNPGGAPMNVLGGTAESGDLIDSVVADFSRPGFQLLRITITDGSSPLRLTVKNTAPVDGVFLTPMWVGFHDGSFDSYDRGSPSTPELERLAEDGLTGPISDLFNSSTMGGQDATITDPEGFAGAPVFDPQSAETTVFNLNPDSQLYFSYASMLIPSNDAFIANGNPTAHRLFNDDGSFVGPIRITVSGSAVIDAGTELNDEMEAAFFNQTGLDMGTMTAEVITDHPGFNGSEANPVGSPQIILGGTSGAGILFDNVAADFSTDDYQVAEILISRAVDGSFSGTWFDPSRDGEGLLVEITADGSGNPRAVVSWYSYQSDNSGQQLWLIGDGPVVGDTAFVELFVTSGAQFGAAFDPADVVREHWGSIALEFNDCGSATLSYEANDSQFGSDSYSLSRLTSGPADFSGACQ